MSECIRRWEQAQVCSLLSWHTSRMPKDKSREKGCESSTVKHHLASAELSSFSPHGKLQPINQRLDGTHFGIQFTYIIKSQLPSFEIFNSIR